VKRCLFCRCEDAVEVFNGARTLENYVKVRIAMHSLDLALKRKRLPLPCEKHSTRERMVESIRSTYAFLRRITARVSFMVSAAMAGV
jgi:hypothetical protein